MYLSFMIVCMYIKSMVQFIVCLCVVSLLSAIAGYNIVRLARWLWPAMFNILIQCKPLITYAIGTA